MIDRPMMYPKSERYVVNSIGSISKPVTRVIASANVITVMIKVLATRAKYGDLYFLRSRLRDDGKKSSLAKAYDILAEAIIEALSADSAPSVVAVSVSMVPKSPSATRAMSARGHQTLQFLCTVEPRPRLPQR